MASLLKAIGLGRGGVEKEIHETLSHLTSRRVPVLMEVEGTQVHFRSVLSVKRGVVVVAKPPGLNVPLKKDAVVRFALPTDQSRALRMNVISGHFNLTSGSAVILCGIPHEFSEGTRRKHMRFNVSRFNNLHLLFPKQQRKYRIIDLSANGCKVYVNGGDAQAFHVGSPLQPAQIAIAKYTADLSAVVPRVIKGKTVGCEMSYGDQSDAHRYIHHLITSLQKDEEAHLSAKAI